MKIECTVEELKELLKKEHPECESECSKNLQYLRNLAQKESNRQFSTANIEIKIEE